MRDETAEWAKKAGAVIRRIRESEDKLLEGLCRSDKALEHSFPGHPNWLTKTLEAVREHSRVAFGAFLPDFSADAPRKLQLRCCGIVKRTPSDEIELKSLAIADRPRNGRISEENTILLSLLIRKVIAFCEARGYPQIEIEVPHALEQEVALLLSLKFKIVGHREKYSAGKSFYLMQRTIGETYKGEPFDPERFGAWLCRVLLPCHTEPVRKADPAGNVSVIDFTLDPAHSVFSQNRSAIAKHLIKGQMFLMDNRNIDSNVDIAQFDILRDRSRQLHYLLPLHSTPEIVGMCKRENIVVISEDDRRMLAGGEESSLHIPILRHDATGIVTVLERSKIEELASKDAFTYFLLSGRGKALIQNFEETDDPLTLLIYCPQWSLDQDSASEPVSGIVGCSKVRGIVQGSYEDAAKHYFDQNPALSEGDLRRYRTYSEKEPVYALTCETLVLLDKPIPIKELPIKKRISKHLQRELIDLWSSISYIDRESCNILSRLITRKGHSGVFVVYSRKDCNENIKTITEMVHSLRKSGVPARWDESTLKVGMLTEEFMRTSISTAKKVLVCISRAFLERIREEGAGVYFEWNIIETELRQGCRPGKYWPIVLEEGIPVPACLKGVKHLEFWDVARRKKQIRELCERIHMSYDGEH